MSLRFDLSTIRTVVDLLKKSDEPEMSVEKFLNKNFSDEGNDLDKKIFLNVCQYRGLLDLALETLRMEENAELVVHLYFLIFHNNSNESNSMLFKSMKQYFSDETIELLVALSEEKKDSAEPVDSLSEVCLINLHSTVYSTHLSQALFGQLKLSNIAKSPRNLTMSKSTTSSTVNVLTLKKTNSTTSSITEPINHFEDKVEQIISKLPQKNKKVSQIKKNTASILRECTLIKRKMQTKNSMVEEMIKGSSDPLLISKSLHNLIEEEKFREAQEIERKHLIGLISLEEAKIAKIEVAKHNQEVADEMKKKRKKLFELLSVKQEERIVNSQQIIKDVHLSRVKVKKSRSDAAHQKKVLVEEMKKLNENLVKQTNELKEHELQRKTMMIEKMKQHDKGSKQVKNDDKYWKMSLEELKQSLHKLRETFELEKKARRSKIQEERDRQKQLISSAEAIIECRPKNLKTKTKKPNVDVTPSTDVLLLREKLAEMRQLTSKP